MHKAKTGNITIWLSIDQSKVKHRINQITEQLEAVIQKYPSPQSTRHTLIGEAAITLAANQLKAQKLVRSKR